MKSNILIIASCFVLAANAGYEEMLAGDFDHVQAYVDVCNELTDVSKYKAYIIDTSLMDGLGGIGSSYVYEWLKASSPTFANPLDPSVIALNMPYSSERSYGQTLGFVQDGDAILKSDKVDDYYFVAFCDSTDGNLYANVLSSDFAYDHAWNIDYSHAHGWQLVPEPTSGLLILLGVGLVALKRRV